VGLTFLTPWDAAFALAAAVPLAALALSERRAAQVRRLFSLPARRGSRLLMGVVALALLPSLLGVAAAQPVVVRQRQISQRSDAQVLMVFDTSLSMDARHGLNGASRFTRAKAEAVRLATQLGDIPVGVAVMTDRTLPVLMPTTDLTLFDKTVEQSLAVNLPPPSETYGRKRATSYTAITDIGQASFFPASVKHPIVVVFTDGETSPLPFGFQYTARLGDRFRALLVHVAKPDEQVYQGRRPNPEYVEDAHSGAELNQLARIIHGRVFAEGQTGAVAATIHADAGPAREHVSIVHYARIALAPWFVLAGVFPLAFLLWRRNA
jgi:hypothetical protein